MKRKMRMTIEQEGLLPHKIILRSPYIYIYKIYYIYIFGYFSIDLLYLHIFICGRLLG